MADSSEHEKRRSGASRGIPAGRALLVLVVFVAVAILALSKIHPSATNATNAPSSGSTTSTTKPSSTRTTTTTSTTIPPSRVPVAVFNGSDVNGAAAAISTQLKPGGWHLLTPEDASTTVSSSTVYYLAGFESQAHAVASSLGLPASAVSPYTTAAPISSIGTAEVAVVVGPDLADKITAAATTTTTTTAAG